MTWIATVTRIDDNPIIRPGMDSRMGGNINGPSLVRVPDWVESPLGRYYLYFAHHTGTYIRMAFADHVEGPWSVYEPGVLDLQDAYSYDHVASPDVHIDHERREFVMYFHGGKPPGSDNQETRVSLSADGLKFTARPEVLGLPYFRAFQHEGWIYAIGMPGTLYRSAEGLSDFEKGPQVFPSNQRHTAVLKRGSDLLVFYTRAVSNHLKASCSAQLTSPWTGKNGGLPNRWLS